MSPFWFFNFFLSRTVQLLSPFSCCFNYNNLLFSLFVCFSAVFQADPVQMSPLWLSIWVKTSESIAGFLLDFWKSHNVLLDVISWKGFLGVTFMLNPLVSPFWLFNFFFNNNAIVVSIRLLFLPQPYFVLIICLFLFCIPSKFSTNVSTAIVQLSWTSECIAGFLDIWKL